MNHPCPQCDGTGFLAKHQPLVPGTHTLWNFFIFFLFFTLMIGAVSVFGSTSFAVWGLMGAMVIYALLSTGMIDLATNLALRRSRKVKCPDCQGTGFQIPSNQPTE